MDANIIPPRHDVQKNDTRSAQLVGLFQRVEHSLIAEAQVRDRSPHGRHIPTLGELFQLVEDV